MTDAHQYEVVNTNGDAECQQQSETTNNTVNADAVTALVQAGLITGGIHQHPPASRPSEPAPRQLLALADVSGAATNDGHRSSSGPPTAGRPVAA